MFDLDGEYVMTTGPGTSGPHQGWPPQPQPGQPDQSGQLGQPGQFGQFGQPGQAGQLGQPGPPGYPAPPAKQSRRTWLIVGAVSLAVLILVCAVVTVVVVRAVRDTGSSGAQPGTGKTTGASGPLTYKVVPDLCVLVDTAPFKQVYPVERDRRPDTIPGQYYTSVSCDIGFSSGKNDFGGGSVRIEADIFGAANAAEGPRRLFDGQRKYTQDKNIATKDVSGLGQAAFSYVEESLGQYLIAHDDNLWLRANFGVLGDATANADDRIARLLKVCQYVMTILKK